MLLVQVHGPLDGANAGWLLHLKAEANEPFVEFDKLSKVNGLGLRTVHVVDNRCPARPSPSSSWPVSSFGTFLRSLLRQGPPQERRHSASFPHAGEWSVMPARRAFYHLFRVGLNNWQRTAAMPQRRE